MEPIRAEPRYLDERKVWRRFWSYVDKNGPINKYKPDLGQCWLWTGHMTSGYGRMRINGSRMYAHVYIYIRYNGIATVPTKLQVCHSCNNHQCVNPAHLYLDTNQGNAMYREATGRGTERRWRAQ